MRRTVAALAFAAAVAYLSSCAKRNAEDAQVDDLRRAVLRNDFCGQYGRLCTLVAQALTIGHAKESVLQAACGRGDSIIPVYVRLRAQRKRTNMRLGLCRAAGMTDAELIQVAREVRTTVEQEWRRRIPVMDPRRLNV